MNRLVKRLIRVLIKKKITRFLDKELKRNLAVKNKCFKLLKT